MGAPGARRAKASISRALHACCEHSGILPHWCPGLSPHPTRVPATCRCQPWGRGVLAGRLSCWRDGLGNRPQAAAWPDRRTLQGAPVALGGGQERPSHPPCPLPLGSWVRPWLGPCPVSACSADVLGESLAGFVFFRWLDCICIMVRGWW